MTGAGPHGGPPNGAPAPGRAGASTPRRFPSLWPVAIAPSLWAAHFLLAYVTAAIWQAKAAPDRGSGPLQVTIAVYTVLALGGIGAIGWRHARLAAGASAPAAAAPAAAGSFTTDAAARRVFTGRLGVLLAGLSAVAVVFTQLAATLGGRP